VKKLACALMSALLLTGLAVAHSSASMSASQKNDSQSQLRSLQGEVMGRQDAALNQAVVYLKNTKTLAVRTYIADNEGKYQFNALSPNVDYEVYAEYDGQKSSTKTLSSFDSRNKAYINLKIDVDKK
jgi:hypothetical protein